MPVNRPVFVQFFMSAGLYTLKNQVYGNINLYYHDFCVHVKRLSLVSPLFGTIRIHDMKH